MIKTKNAKHIHIQDSQPLRTSQQIKLVRNALKTTKFPIRNRVLFDIGINNGIRTKDLLRLKVNDVLNDDGTVKDKCFITETKTGKRRELRFNSNIQEEIKDYLDTRFKSEWLFPSYKNHHEPIKTSAVYQIFYRISHKYSDQLPGLTAHSMRRTFGYHFYKKTHNVAALMRIFNHSSEAITLRYIGITQDEIDNELKHFAL